MSSSASNGSAGDFVSRTGSARVGSFETAGGSSELRASAPAIGRGDIVVGVGDAAFGD